MNGTYLLLNCFSDAFHHVYQEMNIKFLIAASSYQYLIILAIDVSDSTRIISAAIKQSQSDSALKPCKYSILWYWFFTSARHRHAMSLPALLVHSRNSCRPSLNTFGQVIEFQLPSDIVVLQVVGQRSHQVHQAWCPLAHRRTIRRIA